MFWLFSSDTLQVLMFVFPNVSELRFYGCCHPCFSSKTTLKFLPRTKLLYYSFCLTVCQSARQSVTLWVKCNFLVIYLGLTKKNPAYILLGPSLWRSVYIKIIYLFLKGLVIFYTLIVSYPFLWPPNIIILCFATYGFYTFYNPNNKVTGCVFVCTKWYR